MVSLRDLLQRSLSIQASIAAALALRHSLRYRGAPRTLLFAALGLGFPALAESYAVNRARTLRHHTGPQVKGVPLGAVLSWYAITYATFSCLESVWRRVPISRGQRIVLPASTAAVATSLDLLLDCLGLQMGMWEWNAAGPYAREIVGPNGRRGIPLSNFGGWIVLTGGVSLVYLHLAPPLPGGHGEDVGPQAGRHAASLLLPYYVPAAVWALWRRTPQYVLYSALLPVTLLLALSGSRNTDEG